MLTKQIQPNITNPIIAIPSEMPGILTARVSPHFAYCQVHSIITLNNNTIYNIQVIPNNITYLSNNNMYETINKLSSLNVTTLITRGIGLHPLTEFQKSNIQVFFSNNLSTIAETLSAFLKNTLPIFPISPYN